MAQELVGRLRSDSARGAARNHDATATFRDGWRVIYERIGVVAGKKVSENLAKNVKMKKENNGRIRWLNQYAPFFVKVGYLKSLRDEESRLRAVIRKRFAEREPNSISRSTPGCASASSTACADSRST
jgi:hypothetical protein